MAKIAVIYWSGTGNTEAMAQLVAEGAGVAGDEVVLSNVSDISVDEALACDKVALGCPAMGAEELEDGEFQPFYDEFKAGFGSKPLVLFGSYNWADGEWMATWQNDAKDAGLNLVAEGLICYDGPEDGDKVEDCKQLGETLAKA